MKNHYFITIFIAFAAFSLTSCSSSKKARKHAEQVALAQYAGYNVTRENNKTRKAIKKLEKKGHEVHKDTSRTYVAVDPSQLGRGSHQTGTRTQTVVKPQYIGVYPIYHLPTLGHGFVESFSFNDRTLVATGTFVVPNATYTAMISKEFYYDGRDNLMGLMDFKTAWENVEAYRSNTSYDPIKFPGTAQLRIAFGKNGRVAGYKEFFGVPTS